MESIPQFLCIPVGAAMLLLGYLAFALGTLKDSKPEDISTGPMSDEDVEQFAMYDGGVDPRHFTPCNSRGEVQFRDIPEFPKKG